VDQLVRRYLNDPVTHSVDSPHSEVPDMDHHVLHIEAEHRLPILIELSAAPGRTIVFTRTKHGARKLARQLTAARVPAVELHGNLAQNARTRNLAAFAQGQATTLVATDIAARGIHVDDVSLVVHADPPVEHKAYLHRSGRTARAGNSGTVITLMTDAQVGEVRQLTKKARIEATTTRLGPGDPLLDKLAPGGRSLAEPERIAMLTGAPTDPKRSRPPGTAASAGKTQSRRRRGNGDRSGSGNGGNGGSANANAGKAVGTARKRSGSAAAPGSARSTSGKATRSANSASSRTGGAAKASQQFRGRGR
jgi:superfamily II DNA/RNA helicase